MFLKTAISVGPVPPILYFTDQVWAGALLGRFARALELGQGTCFILGALWGSMKVVVGYFPYFIKARSLFSAKCRGVGIVIRDATDLPLCLRNFVGKLYWPVFVASIEAVSAFSIPYGNDMHFPSMFGKGRPYIVPEGYFCILELV